MLNRYYVFCLAYRVVLSNFHYRHVLVNILSTFLKSLLHCCFHAKRTVYNYIWLAHLHFLYPLKLFFSLRIPLIFLFFWFMFSSYLLSMVLSGPFSAAGLASLQNTLVKGLHRLNVFERPGWQNQAGGCTRDFSHSGYQSRGFSSTF